MIESIERKKITRREFLKLFIKFLFSLLIVLLKGERISSYVPEEKNLNWPEEDLLEKWREYETILHDLEKSTPTPTSTATPTLTPTPSQTPSPTTTATKTPTPTPTPKPTPTSTSTPTYNLTPSPEKEFTTKVIYRGPRGTKKVALTIDDTPNPKLLQRLLELCEQYDLKITIFAIGRTMSQESAKIIQDGLNKGYFRLGNHSFSHNISEFSKMGIKYVEQEKNKWIETMKSFGFSEEHLKKYFRPPGGAGGYRGGDPRLLQVLSQNGYEYLVMWDVEFIYYTKTQEKPYTPENLTEIALGRIRSTQGGNIVLFHFNPTDVQALENIVINLKDEGYQFVFPDELS